MVLIWDATRSNAIEIPASAISNSAVVTSPRRKNFFNNYPEALSQTKRDSSPCGHSDAVYAVSFSACGTRILSGSKDQTVRRWDATLGTAVGSPLFVDRAVTHVTSSHDGSRIMARTSDNFACTWDMRTDEPMLIQNIGNTFALSHDGSLLVANTNELFTPGMMVLWNTATGDMIAKLDEVASPVRFVAFSPNDSRLYSYHSSQAGFEGTVYIWDIETRRVVESWSTGHDSYMDFLSLSPTGSWLVSTNRSDDSVSLHNSRTGATPHAPLLGHTRSVTSIAFSPIEAQMASGSYDCTIRLWDVVAGTAISGPIKVHLGSVRSLAFSPDGTRLASGSHDKTIRVWDIDHTDIPNSWGANNITDWSSNTIRFPHHPTYPDWVSHDQKSLTLWLPDHHRRANDSRALLCISAGPRTSPVHLDFSRFVHGTAWTSVISETALLG